MGGAVPGRRDGPVSGRIRDGAWLVVWLAGLLPVSALGSFGGSGLLRQPCDTFAVVAQRRGVRLGGAIRTPSCGRREAGCGEWKATAAEIGQDLELLEVPYTIVTAFRFPLASSYNKATPR
ncbi:hypothetical protein [Streptomyces sp. NPDC007205]|uniref:hypothetical protein n=1 Tax=Streptomyces sp. NPDC007205 TaxID=3154316 RepID=UPI0033F932CA